MSCHAYYEGLRFRFGIIGFCVYTIKYDPAVANQILVKLYLNFFAYTPLALSLS